MFCCWDITASKSAFYMECRGAVFAHMGARLPVTLFYFPSNNFKMPPSAFKISLKNLAISDWLHGTERKFKPIWKLLQGIWGDKPPFTSGLLGSNHDKKHIPMAATNWQQLKSLVKRLLCGTLQSDQNSYILLEFLISWAIAMILLQPYTRYNRPITYQRARQEDPKIMKKWLRSDTLLFKSMAFMSMIYRISINSLCDWFSLQPQKGYLSAVRDLVQLFKGIANGVWLSRFTLMVVIRCRLIILKRKEQQATWYQEPNLPRE